MPLVLANTTLAVSISILSETTLSLPRPRRPRPRCRGARSSRRRFCSGAISQGAWWYLGSPGVCVVLVVLAFNLIGRAVEDILDPREESSVMALLEFDDVVVTYRSRGADVPAVRGVTLSVDAGQTLGIAGESGCGKTTLTSTVLRLQPKTAKVTGEVLPRRRGRARHDVGQGPGRALGAGVVVFQGAMHALNPVQRIGDQIAEPILLHEQGHVDGQGRRARGRAARAGRPSRPPCERLPAPALRRPEAARDDRDGARLRPAAHHRRRADHRARRDGAGAGARPCCRASSRTSASA